MRGKKLVVILIDSDYSTSNVDI